MSSQTPIKKKPYSDGTAIWINIAKTAACGDLGEPSYKRCENSECNRLFDPDDGRVKYCSRRCQIRANDKSRKDKDR